MIGGFNTVCGKMLAAWRAWRWMRYERRGELSGIGVFREKLKKTR
jgi:hypothetical protein